MTVLEDVSKFLIKRAPAPICDDCITTRLGLSRRQHANHKTRELAKMPGFNRRMGKCPVCHRFKKVIHAKRT